MKTLLISFIVAAPIAASAVSFDAIAFWVGSVANRAAVVVDFNDGQATQSYVWGYRWNGTATGEQALDAIVASDPFLTATKGSFAGFGSFLESVEYAAPNTGLFHSRSSAVQTDRFWGYWWGQQNSTSWTFASSGMTNRILSDGAVDGWAFSGPSFASVPPSAPIAAVSEPASLAALAFGAAAFMRKRSKR